VWDHPVQQSVFRDLARENQMPQRFSQNSGVKIGPSSTVCMLEVSIPLANCQK
jgi:hypothetical protein